MAGPYDIEAQVSGYGSPGASALFGVQQELMRRAQVAEQLRKQQAEEARQAQVDALNRDRVQQEIAASKENVASNVETRAANAAKAKQQTVDAGVKQVTESLSPGDVTPEVYQAAVSKIGPQNAALLFAKTPAIAGKAESSDYEGQPATADVPEGQKYLGTDAQRTDEQRKADAQATVNGEHDTGNEAIDAVMHARAQHYLATGKDASATDLASILKVQAKPPASETAGAHKLAMEALQSKMDQGYTPTPQEASDLKVFKRYNPDAQAIEDARNRALNSAADRTDSRAAKTQLFQTKQQFRKDLNTEQTKLDTDLERVDRAQKVLNSPNFLSDAIAAPEVLQIMAGGMGSGLRMTDAELNRVNSAQSALDQLRAKLAKVGIGAPVTLQEDIRKNMKTLIDTVGQARERKAQLMEDTLTGLDSAKSEEDVDKLHAAYWNKKRAAGKTNTLVTPQATTKSGRVPEF